MDTCTCFTVPTDGPQTCGWCGILPQAVPIGPAPDSLAARIAPALSDAALFTRLANAAQSKAARNSLQWLACRSADSARLIARKWAIGA